MTRYLREPRAPRCACLEKELPQATYEVLEEQSEAALTAAIDRLTPHADVIVIDTPGRDDAIARAAIPCPLPTRW